jgi:Flp pilus assembly protein TadD
VRVAVWIGFSLLLTGCLPGAELGAADPTAGNQPPAVDAGAQGVDGLLVGHRLMEAGEYELALKSYYRAAAEQGLNADVLSAIGSADLKLGRLGQAEAILREAIRKDPRFVPALNNLGVVLMSAGKFGEAKSYFQQAYALDSGNSDEIRENLKLAIAQSENIGYDDAETEEPQFSLVRRGEGEYELLSNL